MSRDEFDALIKRLEPFAEKHPRAYFWRVVLLAAFGYVFWFLVIAALLAAGGVIGALMVCYPNGGTLKIGLVLGILVVSTLCVILRALWVRIDAPEGFEAHRSGTPALFAMLDDLSAQLRAPRFHHVLLTSEYNASVVQSPRLGVFGWQRNYLILGLPLMQGLSPEQFRAVLAHELAHLSGNHSRFACWIYRVRKTWESVLNQMQQQQQAGGILLLKFFQWYAPYFNAYTFVLARANEYEADACAARMAGVETTAHALINVQIHSRLVDESFWPGMHRLAGRQPEPEMGTFTHLEKILQAGPPDDSVRKWLRQAFLVQTNNADTHPCLRDRLKAIGFTVDDSSLTRLAPPPTSSVNAAQQLLRDSLPACTRALEIRWEKAVKHQWNMRFKQAEKDRQRLTELRAKSEGRPLTANEQCEQAALVLELDGEEHAAPLFKKALEKSPDHAHASFLLGRILIGTDDEAGIAMLETAMAKDPDVFAQSCNLLHGYFQRTGRHERLRELENRYDQHQVMLQLDWRERQNVTVTDTFLPHELNGEEAAALREQLEAYSEIGRVHLVRKQLAVFPGKPLYVMSVELSAPGFAAASSSSAQNLIDRLVRELHLPGITLIFSPVGGMESLGRVLRLQSWSIFYDRQASGAQAQQLDLSLQTIKPPPLIQPGNE